MTATRNRLYAFMLAVCAAGWTWLVLHLGRSSELNAQLCWIKVTTGLPCPACGSTRAVDALLHGEWLKGLMINPFGLPILLLMLVAPLWIIFDLLRSRDTFFRAYHRAEKALSTRGIAIALVALVLANWIWNYYKGY
jgi:hypothetical protein